MFLIHVILVHVLWYKSTRPLYLHPFQATDVYIVQIIFLLPLRLSVPLKFDRSGNWSSVQNILEIKLVVSLGHKAELKDIFKPDTWWHTNTDLEKDNLNIEKTRQTGMSPAHCILGLSVCLSCCCNSFYDIWRDYNRSC